MWMRGLLSVAHVCMCLYLSYCSSSGTCLSICLSASYKMKLFCKTSSVFELDNIRSPASLQASPVLNVATSKTKQLCQTSSSFQVDSIKKQSNSARHLGSLKFDNVKNEAILRDFFSFDFDNIKDEHHPRLPSKMDRWLQRWQPRTSVTICSKYCPCRETVRPCQTKCSRNAKSP